MSAAPRAATSDDAVLGAAPRFVFEPETLDEAAEALRACARDRLRVVFVGGGTDLGLGQAPAALDAIVRTTRLTRLIEHAPADQIVRVEAGLTLSALQAQLAPHGQQLALDPPLPARATIGGVLCANAFGALRTSRGASRDLVLGASFVRADGVAARAGGKVVKNVAGFDLARLLVGSLGTLALVTSVTWRLHPLPEARATLLLPGLAAAQLRSLVHETLSARLAPAAVAALATEDGFDGAVRFEGFGPGVEQQSRRLLDLSARLGLRAEPLDDGRARAFWARHGGARVLGPFRAKLSAPPAAIEPAAAALDLLRRALPGGSGVWYPTLGLGFVGGAAASADALVAAAAEARALLAALGGALVVHDAPADVRARLDVWGTLPAALDLMRRLKARLDPHALLAPGRFLDREAPASRTPGPERDGL